METVEADRSGSRVRRSAARPVHIPLAAILAGPLPLADARAELGQEQEDFLTLIGRMVDQGRLTLDELGDAIVAAGGLSLVPSRHRLLLNGRQLYTWCALDAVGFAAGLRADARVESRCAGCGAPIWLEFEAGEVCRASHPDLRLSLVAPDLTRSLRDGICAEIGCSCCSAGSEGIAAPGSISLADAVRLGGELCRYGPPIRAVFTSGERLGPDHRTDRR